MAERPTQAEVVADFSAIGVLLGKRFDIRFFEGGYAFRVVPEPSGQSTGVAGRDVVGGPSQGAAAHQQAHSTWLAGQWKDVESGIHLYGNGHKGAFRLQRGLHGDGGLHV